MRPLGLAAGILLTWWVALVLTLYTFNMLTPAIAAFFSFR